MRKLTFFITISTMIFSGLTMAKGLNNKSFIDGYSFHLQSRASIMSPDKSNMIATGQLYSDGAGKVKGSGSFRSNGITCVSTIIGEYTIEANGLGILSTTISSQTPGCASQQLNFEMALSNNGLRANLVNSNDNEMMGTLIHQSKSVFKYNDFGGNYAMYLEGTSSIASLEQSYTTVLGVIGSDGNGNMGGTGVIRSSGIACHGVFSGTYLLFGNGQGSTTLKFTPSDTGCDTRFIYLNMAAYEGGNGAYISSSETDYLSGAFNL